MSEPILERLGAALAERHRLHEELGAGGTATVYLAEDIKQGSWRLHVPVVRTVPGRR